MTVFTLVAWVSVQRAEIVLADRRVVEVQRERMQTIRALYEQVAKAETRRDGRQCGNWRTAAANAAKREISPSQARHERATAARQLTS